MSETQAQPRTWFSGESSPRDKQSIALTIGLVLLVFALVSPLSAIIALICLFIFSRIRISHKVIGGFSLLYIALISVTGFLHRGVEWYGKSFSMIAEAFQEEDFSVTGGFIAQILLYQLTLSIAVGTLIGFGITWYKFFRRPVWQESQFRLGPIQYVLKRRNLKDLKEGKNPPYNGATLGINSKGKKVIQTDEEASSHTFVAGASGSGKTTTMMTQAKDHIRRGHALAFVDLKGGTDVPEVLHAYAEKYGREFYHFTILDPRDPYEGPDTSGPAYYDALGRGDASRRKDMIIAGRRWSEDYYKAIASSYLQTAFNVAIAVPPEDGVDSLSDIISLLNPTNLAARTRRLPSDSYYDEVRQYSEDWTKNKLDRSSQSAIDGVMKELQILRGSSAGKWLREPPTGKKKINLKEIADRGGVVVFSLDSSNYEGLAPLVANFVIQDLKTVSSELRANPSANPMHIYIDEFSAMDSSNVINLINKSRDAKMPVTLSTQALGDLRKVDPTFMEQLLGIINCFIIHRANTENDMEIYAGLTGTTNKWKARYGVEHTSGGILGGGLGQGAATGAGTVEQIEDYRVSPKEIQELKRGQAIYVAMSPEQRLERVDIIPEEGKTAHEDSKEVRLAPVSPLEMDYGDSEGLPSFSPETVRARMQRGLQDSDSASPVAELTQHRENLQDDEPSIDLSSIVPKRSTGRLLQGKDINSSLHAIRNPIATPEKTPNPASSSNAFNPRNPQTGLKEANAPRNTASTVVPSAPSPSLASQPAAAPPLPSSPVANKAPRGAPMPSSLPKAPPALPKPRKQPTRANSAKDASGNGASSPTSVSKANKITQQPSRVSPPGLPTASPVKQTSHNSSSSQLKREQKTKQQSTKNEQKRSVVGEWDEDW